MDAPRPNILIFLVDEMQFDVTQPSSPCQMPALQKFAEEGVTFTRAFTPSPHCCPSRATLMTGVYPSRHGVFNNVETDTAHQFGLNPGVRTFAQDLIRAGYRLSYAGKWHLSNEETPADRGWKEVTSFAKKIPRGHRQWAGRTAKPVVLDRPRTHGHMVRPGWGDQVINSGFVDDILQTHYYQNAVGPGIEELHRLTQEDDPWCLCISTDMGPKSVGVRALFEQYDPSTFDLPPNFHDKMEDKPNIYRRIREQVWGQLSLTEVCEGMASYFANCSLEDCYFKRILQALEETGKADDTLVLFISDHGDYNFAHGLQYMGIPPFREAYHVPVVARWPRGLVAPGRTVDHLVSLCDIAPTLIELAGTTPEDDKSGRSLVPFLQSETPSNWRDDLFFQTNGNEVYYTQRIAMTDRYKYVYNAFDYDELYDLEKDPGELVNLIHPSRYPQPEPFAETPEQDVHPLPRIAPQLEPVRREMMSRIWAFAIQENDTIFSGFAPIAVATYGPMVGLEWMRGDRNAQT